MPQFIDIIAANDPKRSAADPRCRAQASITDGSSMLINPEDIIGMRESTDVLDTLLACGWSRDSAQEQVDDGCPSLVGITLGALGVTIWAFHDLDDILRSIACLRKNQHLLVVQADDVPSIAATASDPAISCAA